MILNQPTGYWKKSKGNVKKKGKKLKTYKDRNTQSRIYETQIKQF